MLPKFSSRLQDNLRLGLFGISVVALWFFTTGRTLSVPSWLRRRRTTAIPQFSKEHLITILDKLAVEFQSIFAELAQMAVSVQKTMKTRGLADVLPVDQMGRMLMEQGFEERLQRAEQSVFSSENITKDDFELATAKYATSLDIAIRTIGLKTMYTDAVNGVLPLLPAVEVPRGLKSQGAIITILEAIHRRKLELFKEIFDTADPTTLESRTAALGSLPSSELNLKLTAATQKAETEILELHLSEIETIAKYRHALAVHSRDDTFKQKRSIIDTIYADKIVEVMKGGIRRAQTSNGSAVGTTDSGVLVILHDALEQVKADDLQLLLVSAAEISRPIVCLVSKKTNGPTGIQALRELSSELAAFEKRHTKEKSGIPSFVFTTLDDYNAANISGSEDTTCFDNGVPFYALFRGNTYKKCTRDVKEAMKFVDDCIIDQEKQGCSISVERNLLSCKEKKDTDTANISQELAPSLLKLTSTSVATQLGSVKTLLDDVPSDSSSQPNSPLELTSAATSAASTVSPPPEILSPSVMN